MWKHSEPREAYDKGSYRLSRSGSKALYTGRTPKVEKRRTTAPVPVHPIPQPVSLTSAQLQILADVPPEIEWFANVTNPNTRRAYRQDIKDFQAFAGLRQPEQFRDITRAH